jgi:hypothetical protein
VEADIEALYRFKTDAEAIKVPTKPLPFPPPPAGREGWGSPRHRRHRLIMRDARRGDEGSREPSCHYLAVLTASYNDEWAASGFQQGRCRRRSLRDAENLENEDAGASDFDRHREDGD